MSDQIKDAVEENDARRFYFFDEREIPEDLIGDFRLRRQIHNRLFLRMASYVGILVGLILTLRLFLFPDIAGGIALHQAYLLNFIVLLTISGVYLIISFSLESRSSFRHAVLGQRIYITIIVLVYVALGWIDMQVAPDYSAIIGAIVYLSVTIWIGLYGYLLLLFLINVFVAAGFLLGVSGSIPAGDLIVEMILFSILGVSLYFSINQGRMHNFINEKLLNRTISELEDLSLRDPLTRLFNRRMMNTELEKELALSKRTSQPLSIILLDLDKFKRVNDSLGHAVGDETLKKTAELLLGGVRESDRVYRFGGEEFLVMLPTTSLKDAAVLAERLCQLFRSSTFDIIPWTVTASMGLADNTERALSADLIKLADCRMYRAKDAGRDRYVDTGCNEGFDSEEPVIPD
ncbi:MAG: GGDEF domain-containing protein [Spirochaetaceae bacterium]|nr:GGDEF domain-containing protein [Spirochaetaceae bacterium]